MGTDAIIYFFDLFGTVIFAITGAVKGVRCRLDFLGVIVFACTVGCGGGMIRDALIGATPVAAFQNEMYLILCIITGIVVFLAAPKFVGRYKIILYCDAIGLGVFTSIGVAKAALFGLGPIGQILCGIMTAVGGGIIRDLMSKTVPAVLTSDFYATASLIGGIIYLILEKVAHLSNLFVLFVVCTLSVTFIRVLAIRLNFHLPVADTLDPVDDYLEMNRHSSYEKRA